MKNLLFLEMDPYKKSGYLSLCCFDFDHLKVNLSFANPQTVWKCNTNSQYPFKGSIFILKVQIFPLKPFKQWEHFTHLIKQIKKSLFIMPFTFFFVLLLDARFFSSIYHIYQHHNINIAVTTLITITIPVFIHYSIRNYSYIVQLAGNWKLYTSSKHTLD